MTDTPDFPGATPRLMTDGGTDTASDAAPSAETVTRTVSASAGAVVTRDVDGEEQDLLRVPISSTRSDREGDRFAKDALEQMADQIRSENPMVFDNHGLAGNWMEAIPYDSRETIGAQMDAELESAEDGEWDLYALVNPDGSHPEGERMLQQVRDEAQPVKFSVGFRVLDYSAIEDDAGNEIGREFTRSDLLETSRVGIPANPDASVTQSLSAKGGGAEGLPGYSNHPMMRMMRAMAGDAPETAAAPATGDVATKGATPDADPDPEPTETDDVDVETDGTDDGDALRERIDTLEAAVSDLTAAIKDDGGDDADACGCKEEGDPCDDNGDCPDGEVCVDGECVPEEETDAFDATDADADGKGDVPDRIKERLEADADLRKEVADLLDGGLERGDSKTGDPDMTDTTAPDEVADGTDDDADAADATEDTGTRTAMDLARGS